jgi:hypothetical protein
VLPLNKVKEHFIQSHRQELSTIADKNVDEWERTKAILKRGGAGFLEGTINRHLLKWETKKKKRVVAPQKVPPLRIRLRASQKIPPLRIRLPPKKKSPKKKSPPKKSSLIVKFPFGEKKSHKKSMIVRISAAKLKKPVTPVKKTKTLADLKMGLAQRNTERAMRGPIGNFRALPGFSQTFGNLIPLTHLSVSCPKTKY